MATNPINPNCPNCNKSGLAILPVRYAVVPPSVQGRLPEPLGDKVTDVKLAHYKYALRTLRQGFVYLYYERHARGSYIKWEVYSVSVMGTLWKQPSTQAIDIVFADPACSRNGHNIPASVISIERPEKCGAVWIAFSEHAWCQDTFALFEKDRVARERRMQSFEPKKWITSHHCHHALRATQAHVGEILEYKDRQAYNEILPALRVPSISQPDGSFSASKLRAQTTRHHFYGRRTQTGDLVRQMAEIGTNASKEPHAPAIIALWDAAGIAQELAGFTHQVVGWVEKYNNERELEIHALNTIEGLKKALPAAASAAKAQSHQGVLQRSRSDPIHPQQRAAASRLKEPQRSRMLEIYDILDDWSARNLGYDRLRERLYQANLLDEPARSATIAGLKIEAEQHRRSQQEHLEKKVEEAGAGKWERYEAKLDKKAYEPFMARQQELHRTAARILEDRTGDLLAWLESPSLISALTEFHTDNVHDGAMFEQLIGELVHGMNGSLKGSAKIDEWVRQMRSSETNLLWRTIALNQKNAMEELDAVLAEASRHKQARTLASTLNWTNYVAKSLKAFADTYKKLVSFDNANTSASSAAGARAFDVKLKPVNMRGVDKFGVSVGDRVFKAFRVNGLADYVSEKIIQHVFAVRAFVSPDDSAKLIEVQAKNEELSRSQTLKRLATASTFMAADMPLIRTAQTAALEEAWKEFKSRLPAGPTAVKDARLAVAVMLIEGVSFNKLIADCAVKNDAKSWWGLTASGLTITSALFDVASTSAKSVFGGESWSYQRLKLAGGILSSAAASITAVLDLIDADKFYGKGDRLTAYSYLAKGILGGASAGLTAATTFTYSAPLIGRLTGHAGLSTAAGAISARAAKIIACRILFMSAGAWLTVVIFSIQIFIWVLSNDALEEWCSLCAFGLDRESPNSYRAIATQSLALANALREIGIPAHEATVSMQGGK